MAQDDKDARLGLGIHFPGRLLGEVIHAASGETIFNRIEHIRKLAVALRRDVDDETIATLKSELNRELDGLSVILRKICMQGLSLRLHPQLLHTLA